MQCKWEDVPNTLDDRGYRKVRCVRGGCQWHGELNSMTPHPHPKILSDCTAWPLPDETSEWAAIFSAALGITQARAAFDAWLHGGAKVEELPAEVGWAQVLPLGEGPGTELKKIFAELGIQEHGGCGCEQRTAEMNRLGPDGCERDRARLLAGLRQAYDEASVITKLKAGTLALAQGLPLSLDGLLTEAIRSAAKE